MKLKQILCCCYSPAVDHGPEPTPPAGIPEVECSAVEDAPYVTYGQIRRRRGLVYHQYCYWRVMSGSRCVCVSLDRYDFF